MRELIISRRAVAFGIFLLLLVLLVGGGNLWATYDVVHASQRKWCQTLTLLVTQQPPPGPAASNPARAYEQHLYRDFRDLRSQLGCG